MREWPDMVTEEFWTFAVRQAVNILNMMPRDKNSKSNYEKFTGESLPLEPQDFHVFVPNNDMFL